MVDDEVVDSEELRRIAGRLARKRKSRKRKLTTEKDETK